MDMCFASAPVGSRSRSDGGADMRQRVTTPAGESFNVPPLRGQLFVCESGCCCGDPDKGYPRVLHDVYHREWERRRLRDRVHLTFTACLGPCVVANLVYLQIDGRSLWFHSLDEDPSHILALFEFIEDVLRDGDRAMPPPLLVARKFKHFMAQTSPTVAEMRLTGNGR
jgi:cobaltochelatase CobN